MGIWIRSQDGKKLVNVNELWRDTKSIYGCHNTTDDAGFILGTYADGSEAMQVLDMIERRIEDNACTELAGPENNGYIRPVFQMPPAEFSEEEGKLNARP